MKKDNSFYNTGIIFDEGALKILFNRYREYVFPLLIVVISLFLFVFVVLPQIQEILLDKSQEGRLREKISILRNNLNYLQNLDGAALDLQFQTASSALPLEKDFVGIINAITIASVNSQVRVEDFIFQVGDLSLSVPNKPNVRPILSLSITINGGIAEAQSFLSQLSKTVPISEVADIRVTKKTASLTIGFYYKPTPQIQFDYEAPIKNLLPNEQATLKEVSSWASGYLPSPLLPATSSASL